MTDNPLDPAVEHVLRLIPKPHWRAFVRLYVFGDDALTLRPGNAAASYRHVFPKAKQTTSKVGAANLLKRGVIRAAVDALTAWRDGAQAVAWSTYDAEVQRNVLAIARGARVGTHPARPGYASMLRANELVLAYSQGRPRFKLEMDGTLRVEDVLRDRAAAWRAIGREPPTPAPEPRP